MIKLIAHVKFKTHAVHITTNPTTGRVICFKYNHISCELESFPTRESSTEYIVAPLSDYYYEVVTSQ